MTAWEVGAMKLDAALRATTPEEMEDAVGAAERLGLSGVWLNEVTHDPFLMALLAVERSQSLQVGTSVAVATVRSPTVLALSAWDLARLSDGRFVLGLGSQVKAHVKRRYGMSWEPPAPKMRDVLGAIRAVWHSWQEGTPLDYQGRFFQLNLMPPFFNPGPISHSQIPIHLAGVGPRMGRLAGQAAHGLHIHPLHSRRYLREKLLPEVEHGLRRAGRSRPELEIVAPVFVVTPGIYGTLTDAAALIRQQIAFYASTPTYRAVLDLHGWGATSDALARLARTGGWAEMADLIDDEMLDTVAIVAEDPVEAGRKLRRRYQGLVDRVFPYVPLQSRDLPWWTDVARGLRDDGGG